MTRSPSLRVLQLIGDTDVLGAHLAALALHRGLVEHGIEVRTLALSPGRRGGLEQDVPAIAPNRWSLAARGQVLAESKWADVVVVHAPRALTLATLAPRRGPSPPVVVAFWESPVGPTSSRHSVARRIVAGAAAIVVADTESAAAVAEHHGRSEGRRVIAADLDDPGRPRPDAATWAQMLREVAP